MSDTPPGWAELLARPLGPQPAVDTPLAAYPCPEERSGAPADPRPLPRAEW